jgi:hypothetical protein
METYPNITQYMPVIKGVRANYLDRQQSMCSFAGSSSLQSVKLSFGLIKHHAMKI